MTYIDANALFIFYLAVAHLGMSLLLRRPPCKATPKHPTTDPATQPLGLPVTAILSIPRNPLVQPIINDGWNDEPVYFRRTR